LSDNPAAIVSRTAVAAVLCIRIEHEPRVVDNKVLARSIHLIEVQVAIAGWIVSSICSGESR